MVNSARIHNASIVLADIHRVGRAFVPSGSRPNWPIFTLPDVDPRIWLTRAKHLAGELGVDGSELAEFAKKSANELNSVDFTQLPEYLCHGDYRMRNLQFTGDEVTGVFDFDASIRARRVLDLGGALTRFSPLGGDPQADVKSGAEFLRTYHQHLPLSNYEQEVLPIFIRWRQLRDVVIYFDYWWLKVRDAVRELFNGVAEQIVNEALSA